MDNPTSFKPPGPYAPTLILHGGAGTITRAHLPPSLYAQYAASLSSYVTSAHALLQDGSSALDAACHAVSAMEDDPLFNCGKGSVFTESGDIEMEASIMVCSVDPDWEGKGEGSVKRGAAVSLIGETRHPILLAREVLKEGDAEWRDLGSMHCQRSGRDVEEWGWGKGLERKGREWFWTRKRWEEHLRGLKRSEDGQGAKVLLCEEDAYAVNQHENNDAYDNIDLPSQGTVGAVCMDSWGNLAVATSTGGLTNKKPGRIGDTPTLGAGFWAESWDEAMPIPAKSSQSLTRRPKPGPLDIAAGDLSNVLAACLPSFSRPFRPISLANQSLLLTTETCSKPYLSPSLPSLHKPSPSLSTHPTPRRAIALSGTGNGDSFLRVCAARTAGSMCRFSNTSLRQAVTNIAGYDGELQRSAGPRWGHTGEGEGGIIGIEVVSDCGGGEGGGGVRKGKVVAEFNCGGMWRAWIEEGSGRSRVMVFREEYR